MSNDQAREPAPFVHERGLCESPHVGAGTRIWAFAHVLPEARIGMNCNICDHVFVENDVVIGDDVTIKCGVQIWDGLRIGNQVFIGPNATFTNDRFPRSKVYPESFSVTTIGDGASIGANATILPGVEIGTNAMVGAGAVVTRNVPPNAVVTGNPAQIVNYQTAGTSSDNTDTPSRTLSDTQDKPVDLGVGGCTLHRLPNFRDMRGALLALEHERDVPFRVRRSFFVFDVLSDKVRGEHAHHNCHQFLVAVHGHLSVVIDDSRNRVEIDLDSPSVGLHLRPRVWGIQYKFAPETVLLVLASEHYDEADYIRDYATYVKHVENQSFLAPA